MNDFYHYILNQELISFVCGFVWITVLYRLTKLFVNLVIMEGRSLVARNAYWFCLSNQHHGYLTPAELNGLKEEKEIDVSGSLAIVSAVLVSWLAVGIMGVIYAVV